MISDFLGADGPRRPKPKRIEPLEQEPRRSIHELAAEHEAAEAAGVAEQAPEQATAVVAEHTPELYDTPSQETLQNENEVETTSVNNPSQVKSRTGFFSARWTLSKKWTVVVATLSVLLIGGAATFAYLSQPRGQGGVSKNAKVTYVPKDTRVPNTLTGRLVDPAINQRPVTGVMIENSQDARPQSGLDQAGVVFEAIAEGGITRFLALFQDTQPDYLGPVRSARPYYVQWCMSFDCAYAHAGGSPEAIQDIRDWGTKDLNDAVGYFWRVSSRYAPHNLYTSLGKLNEYEAARGYGAPTFTGFARKKDQAYKAPAPATSSKTKPAKSTAPADTRTAASSIDFAISSGLFNAHFDYDAGTNSYRRSQAGAPHMVVDSAGNQTQISPKVVVGLVMSYGVAADKHSQYGSIGSGQAFIFQDGTVTEATWAKADVAGPLTLKDAAGADIQLNAGQTWLTALSGANLVTYR